MSKTVFSVTVCAALLLSMPGFTQGGPYTLSIGTGVGSLDFALGSSTEGVYSWGNVRGDIAAFEYAAGLSDTTIWNICWFVYDVNNASQYFMDVGFTGTAHTSNRPTDGTISTSATQVSNSGMGYPNSAGLTSDMVLNLDQPTPGDTARATWTWTFYNSNASAMDIRVIWFVDSDVYLDTNDYFDDYVAFEPSTNNSGRAIALGNSDGSGNVGLNEGMLMDADVTPSRHFGISDNLGSSYYWSSSYNYAGKAPEDVQEIHDDYTNIVEDDADSDKLSDLGQDVAGVLQFDLTVPASGSTSLNCYLTWGLNQTASDVSDWSLY